MVLGVLHKLVSLLPCYLASMLVCMHPCSGNIDSLLPDHSTPQPPPTPCTPSHVLQRV